MMNENKRAFLSSIETALMLYSRIPITAIRYVVTENGFEFAEIHFVDAHVTRVNITGDSCIAILHDLYRALS
jgi:uncharacterized membrane protein YobD (UPF0266 family)